MLAKPFRAGPTDVQPTLIDLTSKPEKPILQVSQAENGD